MSAIFFTPAQILYLPTVSTLAIHEAGHLGAAISQAANPCHRHNRIRREIIWAHELQPRRR